MSLSADQRPAPARRSWSATTAGFDCLLLDTTFKCLGCGQGLDVDYDYGLAAPELPRWVAGRAPAEHLAIRGAVADRQSRRCADEGRAVRRPDAVDPRRAAGRELGAAQALPQGRLDPASLALLQGPGRRDGCRAALELGQQGDRLRLDRQRRHRRRLAGLEGGGRRPTSSIPPTSSGPRRAAAARSAPR